MDLNLLLVILLVILCAILWLGSLRGIKEEVLEPKIIVEVPEPVPIETIEIRALSSIDVVMAVDTASKRGSAICMLCPWRAIPPIPDGTIDQGDRQHAAWMYSGILAGAPVIVTGGSDYWRFITLVHNQ